MYRVVCFVLLVGNDHKNNDGAFRVQCFFGKEQELCCVFHAFSLYPGPPLVVGGARCWRCWRALQSASGFEVVVLKLIGLNLQ